MFDKVENVGERGEEGDTDSEGESEGGYGMQR